MKRIIGTLLLVIISASPAAAWSSLGHKIVAYIAKRHLSDDADAALDDILWGNSIVYYGSWLDSARNDPEYAFTSTWHYINVDEGEDYFSRSSLDYTDAVTALYEQSDLLREEWATDAERELAVKAIIHIVGDLHQPMHAGHASDLGGNRIRVNYMGESTNLHSVWDYNIVNSAHPWNYYEWQQALDVLSPEQVDEVTAGNFDDWGQESVAVAASIYRAFRYGASITQSDVTEWTPVVEQQLLRGGLRLAAVFNDVFNYSNGLPVSTIAGHDTHPMIYNLQGLPVSTNVSALPAGIYIRSNGTKFVKR